MNGALAFETLTLIQYARLSFYCSHDASSIHEGKEKEINLPYLVYSNNKIEDI